jgi:hypothetical protein
MKARTIAALTLAGGVALATLAATGARADTPAYYTRYATLTLTAGYNDTFDFRALADATCDDSDAATGGGYDVVGGGQGVVITSSAVTGSNWNGWEAGGYTTGTTDTAIHVWVVCVTNASNAGIIEP